MGKGNRKKPREKPLHRERGKGENHYAQGQHARQREKKEDYQPMQKKKAENGPGTVLHPGGD